MKRIDTNLEKNIDADNPKKEKSFATGLNFYKLFWIFYIGCFFGVVVETIWCIVTNGYFESRTALILEPLNPVYGIGAVLISVCFVRMTGWKNIFIYIGSFVVGGAFEWLCSFFQEMVFGTVSWYYGKDTLGIFERTSLVYCIFWGFLGILWVRLIYPFMSKMIEKIPNKVGKTLTWILIFIVSFDILFTSGAALRQKERRAGKEPNNIIEQFYDEKLNDEVLKKYYPNMTVVK
ncbi:MAG: putative ABC transporter permease [Clostridia bacterium]|nr:putative ABC transporter permease [Clostridia bacterium]